MNDEIKIDKVKSDKILSLLNEINDLGGLIISHNEEAKIGLPIEGTTELHKWLTIKNI